MYARQVDWWSAHITVEDEMFARRYAFQTRLWIRLPEQKDVVFFPNDRWKYIRYHSVNRMVALATVGLPTKTNTPFPLPAVAYTNVTLEVCVEDYTHFAKHLLLKIYKRPETRCEVPFSIAVMKNPERLKRQQTVFIPESCVSNAMRHIAESYGVKVRRDGTSGYFLFYDGKE